MDAVKRRIVCWCFMACASAGLGLLVPADAVAEVSATLRGGAQSRLYAFDPAPKDGIAYAAEQSPPENEYDYGLELRLRPELLLGLTDDLTAVVTVNLPRQAGRPVRGFGRGQPRIDRAYLDYRIDRWDFRIGRQAINFGAGQIWNPVDLIDANTPLNFQVEKRGVDGIRSSFSISPTSRLIALAVAAEGGAISLLRGEFLLGPVAGAVLMADDRRRQEQVIGLDMKGEWELGFWLEGAVHVPSARTSYLQVVAGVDYSFSVLERLTVSAQYFHDSSGGTGVENYDYNALMRGERQFLGRQYLSSAADLAVDVVSNLRGAAIVNLEDRNYLLALGITRAFDSLEATVRYYRMGGSEPGEFKGGAGNPLSAALSTDVVEFLLDWRF